MGKRMELTAAQASAGFGQRLAGLRRAAGFTQVELAAELGISQRMAAYYESPRATPPANLLPAYAQTLGVSIDDLFELRPPRKRLAKQLGDSRMRRRMLALDKLDAKSRRQVTQILDSFIEAHKLKARAISRAAAGG